MKKMIISFTAAILLLVCLYVPVSAADYIQTDDSLTKTEAANIQSSAESIKQKYGTDVFFVYDKKRESAVESAELFLKSHPDSESYFIFSVTEKYYYCTWSDDLSEHFYKGIDEYILDSIYEYMDEDDSVYDLCSGYYAVVSRLFESKFSTPYRYVRDLAGVLTDSEEKALDEKLTALSKKYRFDIVVVTANGVKSENRMSFADDYYDYNYYRVGERPGETKGFGYGEERDGALLLVNVGANDTYSSGNSWISTCGKGIDYIDDDDIQSIGKVLTPKLLRGDYTDAFETFADMATDEIRFYNIKVILIIVGAALIIALISAFAYTKKLKKQLISVAAAADANNYIVSDSLNIKRAYDNYLYSTVTKTRKESKSSSGSSSHTSSSGTSHGGGGF